MHVNVIPTALCGEIDATLHNMEMEATSDKTFMTINLYRHRMKSKTADNRHRRRIESENIDIDIDSKICDIKTSLIHSV
jgi:hypothetical protein